MSAYAGVDQFNALVGAPLDRGKTPVGGASLATGTTYNMDATVGGEDLLNVMADLSGAGAAGDVTVQVFPYGPDGVTLLTTPLPAVSGVGFAGTLNGGHACLSQQYAVQGIDRVQIQVKNNNAATKTVNASWRTENN